MISSSVRPSPFSFLTILSTSSAQTEKKVSRRRLQKIPASACFLWMVRVMRKNRCMQSSFTRSQVQSFSGPSNVAAEELLSGGEAAKNWSFTPGTIFCNKAVRQRRGKESTSAGAGQTSGWLAGSCEDVCIFLYCPRVTTSLFSTGRTWSLATGTSTLVTKTCEWCFLGDLMFNTLPSATTLLPPWSCRSTLSLSEIFKTDLRWSSRRS
mmetsp:Transcript_23073/g.37318  ORF Transcript_23073/g.37318 Transcript_23073/m.37318 type:complete len:209 (-) Transcript_23073:2099-2725(-)